MAGSGNIEKSEGNIGIRRQVIDRPASVTTFLTENI
jgi:hypothetical protein